MFPKVAEIVETAVLTYNDPFGNSPKSHQSFWANFVSKFVAKNFKKSPIWSHCPAPFERTIPSSQSHLNHPYLVQCVIPINLH